MDRALVLNATYEPLSVVGSRRALVLVLTDRAFTVHASGRVVHSERLALPEPSVVRLARYVHVPHVERGRPNRRMVFLRDDCECQYCGHEAESIDHVIPRSRGGGHSWDNVVAACRRCNTVKRDRLLAETTMQLRRPPCRPAAGTWLAASVSAVPEHWDQYLHLQAS